METLINIATVIVTVLALSLMLGLVVAKAIKWATGVDHCIVCGEELFDGECNDCDHYDNL